MLGYILISGKLLQTKKGQPRRPVKRMYISGKII
jgi:hypothetical protein